ncbi:SH3 domain-containing protein [Streptomyces sp. NRRL S-378]|uniref:SH3 domain-containing protein n=1 Tax=Streptomyces sp. NRRL S-378 TaxID=1463904 RepID=UPI0004C881E3|nr:SH3 domain-containing protein [Streptomyces sp. NRRL S-378]
MNIFTRRVATVAATGALLLGGALTTASTASAATIGSGACTHQIKINTDVYTAVNFRTGPGTGYTATGLLSKGTDVYWQCNKGSNGKPGAWGYVTVKSGAHKGKKGWVAAQYINVPMQLD